MNMKIHVNFLKCIYYFTIINNAIELESSKISFIDVYEIMYNLRTKLQKRMNEYF